MVSDTQKRSRLGVEGIPWFVDALAGGLALLLPTELHSEPTQLNGLGGACSSRADGVLCRRRVPHVGKNRDTCTDISVVVAERSMQ
jgi:hypothetical protein